MGWALVEQEITFAGTGRTAIVRPAPNLYALFSSDETAPYLDEFQGGKLDDPVAAMRITEEIVRAQMVRPRIARRDETLPPDQDPEDPEVVPYQALEASEVDELVERWSEAAERAARFRDERAGGGGRAGGKSVGSKAKRSPRAAARKP